MRLSQAKVVLIVLNRLINLDKHCWILFLILINYLDRKFCDFVEKQFRYFNTIDFRNVNYLLGNWVADARAMSDKRDEQNLYQFNALNLVTLWG
jgi:hypothetical protein